MKSGEGLKFWEFRHLERLPDKLMFRLSYKGLLRGRGCQTGVSPPDGSHAWANQYIRISAQCWLASVAPRTEKDPGNTSNTKLPQNRHSMGPNSFNSQPIRLKFHTMMGPHKAYTSTNFHLPTIFSRKMHMYPFLPKSRVFWTILAINRRNIDLEGKIKKRPEARPG